MPTDRDSPAPPFGKDPAVNSYVPDARLDFIDKPRPATDPREVNPPGKPLAYRGSQRK